MLDPAELYQVASDAPELEEPVLLLGLDGFVDAGNATRLALAAHFEPRGDHVRFFSPATLRDLLNDLGFDVLEARPELRRTTILCRAVRP